MHGDIVTLLWIHLCGVRPCIDLLNKIETKVVCLFIKHGRHVHYDERTNPIDFWRSKVKVTIDIHGIKLVNTIENKPSCAFSSNLAGMLTMVRG